MGGASERRSVWLAAQAQDDPGLATDVRAYLKAADAASAALPTDPPPSAGEDGPDPHCAAPDRIGAYRLVRRLGGGGMGEVFLGERDDGLFEHKVAVKMIRSERVTPELAARFHEERRILARLRHPNIVQLYDGGADPSGHAFMIMEYLPGDTIIQHAAGHDLALYALIELFLDVCAAVDCAHRNFIVHADIKPANIIVTPDAGPKLIDFGIARPISLSDLQPDRVPLQEPMTRAYAPPERRRGARPSISSDVYALGVILYELLTGKTPPEDEAGSEDGDRELTAGALGLAPSCGPASDALKTVLVQALHPDPRLRYRDVGDLQAALVALLPALAKTSPDQSPLRAPLLPLAEGAARPWPPRPGAASEPRHGEAPC
jgi:serine/threonine protein kinase